VSRRIEQRRAGHLSSPKSPNCSPRVETPGPTLSSVSACFLWIFLCGPYIEKLRGDEALATTLSAVTAAVVGVVLNLAVWFGGHVIFPGSTSVDWIAILISTVAWIGMIRWQWNIILVVLGAGGAGLIFKSFL
jgi:chromate transporter